MKSRNNRAFTLIELLVVIAIIGILASIVLVSINSSRKKAINTRIQAEISQIRTQLEQGFTTDGYLDVTGSASHALTLTSTGNGTTSIAMTACDIGNLLAFPDTVTNDLVLNCDGVSGLHTGVIIYSTMTGSVIPNYGIYATTSPGGYVCIDSFGNTNATTSGSIPTYSAIVSTSTALCQ